jgi:hypothetical protein
MYIKGVKMKYDKFVCLVVSLFSLFAASRWTHAAPLGTAFTYQGQLIATNGPASGNYDMVFALFDAPDFGSQVGTTLTNLSVAVSNGLFTTSVDFGAAVFDGTAYWLAIGVRTNGAGAFAALSPRQPVSPAPYALFASAAGLADGSVTGLKILDGTITSADLAPNSVNSGHIIDGQVATADVANNAINSAKVLDGTLLGADMANNTVSSLQLADTIALGDAAVAGRLDVYRTSNGLPAITLFGTGSGGYQYLYQNDGQAGIYLDGDVGGGGLQQIYAADGSVGITLDGESSGAGLISLQNTNGLSRMTLDGSGTGAGGQITVNALDGSSTIQIYGESTGAGLINVNNNVGSTRLAIDGEGNGAGGQITLYAGDGATGINLFGDSGGGGLQYLYAADGSLGVVLDGESGGAGFVSIYNTNGSTRVALDGFNTSTFGGEISIYDASTTETIELLGAYTSVLGGMMRAKQADGTVGVEIASELYAGDGGDISVNNAAGGERMELDGDDGDGGAVVRLRNGTGTTTITLDADVAGDGRITTQELSITGGSDLSEKFDVSAAAELVTPGALVCIDPQNPGKLTLSSKAYDRTVAGVVSGAGGVKTGMMMGQKGSLADGEHPVALTGRVFCMVNADQGAIEPGDLITTSDLPGHGMKVSDHTRAQGAIVGKAMTGLAEGKGLVLVLVSLQ